MSALFTHSALGQRPRLPAFFCFYDAGQLSGADGSTVLTLPNLGAGGSLYDLTAVVPAGVTAPTLHLTGGPGGTPAVFMPAGAYFATTQQTGQATALGPLSGAQDRSILLISRMTAAGNQDKIYMGVAGQSGGGNGCGIYQSGDNYWSIYGAGGVTNAGDTTHFLADFWRGQGSAGALNVYRQADTTPVGSSTFPSNTVAAAPLKIGAGVIFTSSTQDQYLAVAGVHTGFFSNAQVAQMKATLTQLYGLSL